jgi:hypothetical protein
MVGWRGMRWVMRVMLVLGAGFMSRHPTLRGVGRFDLSYLIDAFDKLCYNAVHYGRVAQLVRAHGSHP